MARERWTRSSWTWASPPSSSTRSHEASPTPARRPSTCAWIRARALPPRICWSPPTPQDLAELVRQAVPAPARRSGGHPAKRTFQALRIAVNAELDVLERAVPRALNSLRVGGRLVVESYQSLEDRIVKRALNHGATSRAPQDLPVVPEVDRPYLELLTNGAEKADTRELDHNPRSAPVRLRAAVRLRPADQAPAPEERPSSGGPGRSGRRAGRRAHRDRAR